MTISTKKKSCHWTVLDNLELNQSERTEISTSRCRQKTTEHATTTTTTTTTTATTTTITTTTTVSMWDVKSSRPKWPQGQNFGFGLEALASASNIWPRPGLGQQQKNQQPRRDWPVCLPTTGHDTMIHVEGSYCARENEKLNCVVLIIMVLIHLYAVNHHLVLYIHNFIFGLGLKKLASALTSKPWPWSRPQDPGLKILASFNITV